MSPRFPRPTVSVRNILFKSFGGGRSPFYLTLPLLQRSNACIIAQTMSNCFSFSIFQCFFRCLLVDCRGSQFFFSPLICSLPTFSYLFLNFSHCLHTFCTQCFGLVSVYLLCKEASKRSLFHNFSPFFRQYEMGSTQYIYIYIYMCASVCHFPSKLVYKGRQTQPIRPLFSALLSFRTEIENAF